MIAVDVVGRPVGFVEVIATMGTMISVDVRSGTSRERFREAVREVADRLRDIDRLFSAWQPESWVSRLIDGRVLVPGCPPEVQHIIGLANDATEVTDGWFSPFWREGGRRGHGPDPTGLLKGWAAQQASTILLSHAMPDHVVNAAGDLVVSGTAGTTEPHRLWRVGVSDMPGGDGLVGVIELDGSDSRWAVATSGTAERGQHVLDPRTGRAATGVRTATVVARLDELQEAGAMADAGATALVAAGSDAIALAGRLAERGLCSLMVADDGTVHDPHALLAPILDGSSR